MAYFFTEAKQDSQSLELEGHVRRKSSPIPEKLWASARGDWTSAVALR